MTAIRFTVEGDPAPKGSMKAFWSPRHGKVVSMHDNPRTVPWQQAVMNAAARARGAEATIMGAVAVTIRFHLERPISLPKRETLPTKTRGSDLDKLIRAVLDALTKARVYRDDAQVVALAVSKEFGKPRAEIEVHQVDSVAPALEAA